MSSLADQGGRSWAIGRHAQLQGSLKALKLVFKLTLSQQGQRAHFTLKQTQEHQSGRPAAPQGLSSCPPNPTTSTRAGKNWDPSEYGGDISAGCGAGNAGAPLHPPELGAAARTDDGIRQQIEPAGERASGRQRPVHRYHLATMHRNTGQPGTAAAPSPPCAGAAAWPSPGLGDATAAVLRGDLNAEPSEASGGSVKGELPTLGVGDMGEVFGDLGGTRGLGAGGELATGSGGPDPGAPGGTVGRCACLLS